MNRQTNITHQFVDAVPDQLVDGTLYVCIPYATAVHACCCGCGSEIVTPFTPTDWSLTFDGDTVSLSPSVGNWSFECRSHYIINRGHVRWASTWSRRRVEKCRRADRIKKSDHYDNAADPANRPDGLEQPSIEPAANASLWKRWRRRLANRS